MKPYAKSICLLIAIILFSACGADYASTVLNTDQLLENEHIEPIEKNIPADEQTGNIFVPELTLVDVFAIANERRQSVKQPDILAAQELLKGYTPGIINVEDLTGGNLKLSLSREEAIFDAEKYFSMLRHTYGGYTYFGGDEIFLPIFDDIIEALSKQEEWPTMKFVDEIHSQLSRVIFDNHLFIDMKIYAVEYDFYAWEMPFDKNGDRFLKRDSGLHVAEIEGYDLDEVFRLAVNEEGEFFYIPIFMEPKNLSGNLCITVIYDNGDKEIVSLKNPNRRGWPLQDSMLRYKDDIPIVVLRKMYNPFVGGGLGGNSSNANMEDAIRFLSFAEELKDENVIIIDIRSNQGGYSILSNKWLYLLTGEIVPNNFLRVHYDLNKLVDLTETLMQQEEDIINNPYYDLTVESLDQMVPFGEDHFISNPPDRIISNDKLIIFLIDRYVYSAGEVFTDLINSIENTLVIGQNTAGTLITGGFITYYLPNSNVAFSITHSFHIFDEAYFREGVGIAPDVWVVGDASKAALAILGSNE